MISESVNVNTTILAKKLGAKKTVARVENAEYASKENKELLSYLLFEAYSEDEYIRQVKEEIDLQFLSLNKSSFYLAKKIIYNHFVCDTFEILENIRFIFVFR